jgi:serine/threonine protein kinase
MMAQRAEPPSPQAGDVVAGKYHLLRPIGLGAMGLVFEATHLRMKQPVAIKFMQSKLVNQPEAIARFEREGRAAARLTSPHATRILDVDTTPEGVPYIVSELLEGHDLRHELDKRGRLPVEEAVGYVIQACAVMAEAHSLGIVHRDLKPSNLFLARTSAGRVVKVLDFGISKMEEELELTTTGILLGSPRYMSPEQVEAKRVDRRADIWALGVILFRSISGTYPFEGSTSISLALAILTQRPRDLRTVVPDLPPELIATIGKALAPDLEARYSTARDLAEALAAFATPELAGLAKSLPREVPAPEPSRPSLSLPTPGADTVTTGQPAIDALIEISFEPPETATRGTFAQPSTPARASRKGRWVLAIAGAVGSAVLAAAFLFFARSGSRLQGQPSSSTEAEPPRASAAAAPPASPAPAEPTTVSASPTATPAVEASASAPPSSARPLRPAPARPGATPAPRSGVAPPSPPKNPTYL